MVAGGVTAGDTPMFDVVWVNEAPLKIPRAYHAAELMADGSVFTLGGFLAGGEGGKMGEIWTAQFGWRVLSIRTIIPDSRHKRHLLPG